MKLLVVHPQDDLLSGPWRSVHWDRIIDIGRSGAQANVIVFTEDTSIMNPIGRLWMRVVALLSYLQ